MNNLTKRCVAALFGLLCVGCGDGGGGGTITAPLEVSFAKAAKKSDRRGGGSLACRAHYGVVEEWYWDRGDGTGIEGYGFFWRDCDDPTDPSCAPQFGYQLWRYDGAWSKQAEGVYAVALETVKGDGVTTLEFEIEPPEGRVKVEWERTTAWADTWTREDGFYGDFSASATGEVLGVPITPFGFGGNPMVWMSAYGCPEEPASVSPPPRDARLVEHVGAHRDVERLIAAFRLAHIRRGRDVAAVAPRGERGVGR